MGETIKKIIKSKIVFKHETEKVWHTSNNGGPVEYIPELGEKILYDPDENYSYTRIKYGDGERIVAELPFSTEQANWEQEDEKATDFIKNKPDVDGKIDEALRGSSDIFIGNADTNNGIKVKENEIRFIDEGRDGSYITGKSAGEIIINAYEGLRVYDNTGTVSIAGDGISINDKSIQEIAFSAKVKDLEDYEDVTNKKIDDAVSGLKDGVSTQFDTLNKLANEITSYESYVDQMYVKQETGKGLSDNNFTTEEKTKLSKTLIADDVDKHIDAAIAELVDTAPGTLDTLNELAAALGDDPNFATTVTNELNKKIETVKVNGTALAVNNKAVNVTVPTGALADKDKVEAEDFSDGLVTMLDETFASKDEATYTAGDNIAVQNNEISLKENLTNIASITGPGASGISIDCYSGLTLTALSSLVEIGTDNTGIIVNGEPLVAIQDMNNIDEVFFNQETRFYRILTPVFVQNRWKLNNWVCYVVNDKSTVESPVYVQPEQGKVVAYYDLADNSCYAWVNEWIALGLVANQFGLNFQGTITDISQNAINDSYNLLLEYKLYWCKDGKWYTNNEIGIAGTGDAAEVFNSTANTASCIASHAEGHLTKAKANYAHAEGYNTTASGKRSHAEGNHTTASGDGAHAEGVDTQATHEGAHAEGCNTRATNYYAHAEGQDSQATGNYSHAEGKGSMAKSEASHAEGVETEAKYTPLTSGETYGGEHAEGYKTKAYGKHSHAEGWETQAIGQGSHAEGYASIASGSKSHAGGHKAEAKHDFSFAHGYKVTTSRPDQVVFGRRNIDNTEAVFIIGGGDESAPTPDEKNRNIFWVERDGRVYTQYGEIALKDEIYSATGIIDVVALPTQLIDDNRLYRLTSAYFVENQWKNNYWECIVVNALRNVTNPIGVVDNPAAENPKITAYYDLETKTAYGYYSGTMVPLENIAPAFGLTYEGVTTDITSLPTEADGHVGILVEYNLYNYKDGKWNTVKQIGWHGTGNGAEIFNTPSNIASGIASHAEGYLTEATGNFAHAEGLGAKATGRSAHAEGTETVAQGDVSHAEGTRAKAFGNESHAEGYETTANSHFTHAEGYQTLAGYDETYTYADDDKCRGQYAHAEGEGTKAINYSAHAEGKFTLAAGTASHAGGEGAEATGLRSFTHGWYTKAKEDDQFVVGKFNADNKDALFVVGNGSNDNDRSNAFYVTNNGAYVLDNKQLVTTDTIVELNKKIQNNTKQIKYTQQGLTDEIFITDNTSASVKIVPVNVMEYAELSDLKGDYSKITSFAGNQLLLNFVKLESFSDLTITKTDDVFDFVGYTCWGDNDVDENYNPNKHPFISIPVSKGVYEVKITTLFNGYSDNNIFDVFIDGVSYPVNEKIYIDGDGVLKLRIGARAHGGLERPTGSFKIEVIPLADYINYAENPSNLISRVSNLDIIPLGKGKYHLEGYTAEQAYEFYKFLETEELPAGKYKIAPLQFSRIGQAGSNVTGYLRVKLPDGTIVSDKYSNIGSDTFTLTSPSKVYLEIAIGVNTGDSINSEIGISLAPADISRQVIDEIVAPFEESEIIKVQAGGQIVFDTKNLMDNVNIISPVIDRFSGEERNITIVNLGNNNYSFTGSGNGIFARFENLEPGQYYIHPASQESHPLLPMGAWYISAYLENSPTSLGKDSYFTLIEPKTVVLEISIQPFPATVTTEVILEKVSGAAVTYISSNIGDSAVLENLILDYQQLYTSLGSGTTVTDMGNGSFKFDDGNSLDTPTKFLTTKTLQPGTYSITPCPGINLGSDADYPGHISLSVYSNDNEVQVSQQSDGHGEFRITEATPIDLYVSIYPYSPSNEIISIELKLL